MTSENFFILNIAKRVYQELGPGHTEFIYHRAMEVELRSKNIDYESEKRVIINYNSNNKVYTLGEERIDLFLINEKIIIELKAMITAPKEGEIAQVNKYYRELKKGGLDATYGIIINFPQAGTKMAKEEIDFIQIKY